VIQLNNILTQPLSPSVADKRLTCDIWWFLWRDGCGR